MADNATAEALSTLVNGAISRLKVLREFAQRDLQETLSHLKQANLALGQLKQGSEQPKDGEDNATRA